MIVTLSENSKNNIFIDILKKASDSIWNDAILEKKEYFLSRDGKKFEDDVFEYLINESRGTIFEDSFVKISGQKFPDIILNGHGFGIEVKTTTQNHWKTTGNSIFEETRVDGIDNLYLFFAKIRDPFEVKYRKYQDCLINVAVTHSPRYLIDMEAKVDETIFEKIACSYDDFRKMENPILKVREFYRKKLRPGESLWWLDDYDSLSNTNGMIIQVFSNLDKQKKREIICQAMIFFPEIFGSSNEKFERLASWMIIKHNVVCSSLRDLFSAGGKGLILKYDYKSSKAYPKIILKLFENLEELNCIFNDLDPNLICEYWNIEKENNINELKKRFVEIIFSYNNFIQWLKCLNLEENQIQNNMREVKDFFVNNFK